MESSLLQYILEQGVAIAVLWIWGYFMIKYFMNEIKRKDDQNQANLDKFIDLVKEGNLINTKIFEALDNTIPNKLNDIHSDIKILHKTRTTRKPKVQ